MQNLEKYQGKWVALDKNKRVIVFGTHVAVVKSKAEKKMKDPILFRVPKRFSGFVGSL